MKKNSFHEEIAHKLNIFVYFAKTIPFMGKRS